MNEREYSRDKVLNYILDKSNGEEFTPIEENLVHELLNGKVSTNINEIHEKKSSVGDKVADKIATFGGSWGFIIIFICTLVVWFIINTVILTTKAFDPYPFIFLNLVLSCLSAIQAPLILMSQNRQSAKDRLTADDNYLVNFKTELIIENIHYKLDELIENQKSIYKLQDEINELKKTQEILLKKLEN